MNLNEVLARVDIEKPYFTSLDVELSSQTDKQEATQITGADDIFITECNVDFIDADGTNISITDNTIYDDITVEVKSSNSANLTDNVFGLRNLISKSFLNRGWLWKRECKYTFKLSGNNIATSTFAKYPVRIRLNFNGYRIKN